MKKVDRRYVLLILTWCIVLASIIYPWVTKTSTIHIGQWILLVIISLIPLAERLKIGEWFDFRSKVNSIDKEVTSVRKNVDRIESQLNTYFTAVQRQQQFNVSLLSEEAAKGFAESISQKMIKEYSDEDLTDLMLKSRSKDMPAIKAMQKDDLDRIYFLNKANRAIASTFPLVDIIFAGVVAKLNNRLPESSEISDKDTLSQIKEIRENAPKVFDFASDAETTFKSILDPIEQLITLRNDVYKHRADVPSVEQTRKLVSKVHFSAGYLTGMASVAFSFLLLMPRLIEKEKFKPN